ncbi:TetR/AcrR family transcriptional regulator [Pseudonocardia endophytica]|uniref:TetR family transcriptional regulator n=1 Tax=Pseudonocardia endophytica TaxID=401976 RepID=A0A4R1HMH7_PSEEN|nr:TetR family transcriptional regulator [Pseudonocardia endophytica]TCK21530.1 TetR family transcriptional regulator [Pseudonocardia endophytica]
MVTRAEQAERTRAGILDTARRLFAAHGYTATSLQRIADEHGVTKANVYYYFRTKDALLDALMSQHVDAVEAVLDRAEAASGRADRIGIVVDGFVDQVVRSHRALAPVDPSDPGVRNRPTAKARIDELWERGMRLLFGEHPTVDEIAGFRMLNDLRPVTTALTHLGDDELRGVLRRVCLRLIPGAEVSGSARPEPSSPRTP